LVEPDAGGVDIATADFLLSLGRGIGEKDAIEQFDELAGKMGATLSASRPLVDAGWVGSERQVGQSGKTVKPKVYLAFGISGAVQHLAGIFNQAHFGAVADLFEVADELEKLY
jgi:electron transfer flavoprotein alpha subunit